MYQLDFYTVLDYLPLLFQGVYITLKISILSIIGGTLFGFLGTLLRIPNYRVLNFFVSAYIEWFRNIPLFIHLMFIHFGVGSIFNIPSFIVSILVLSLFSGAYIIEIIRSGIQSIPKDQIEVSYSLGATKFQTFWYIIFPQALRVISPTLLNQFISIIKDSSLVSIIAIVELTFVAREIISSTFRAFEIWFITAMFYFIISFILSRILNKIEEYWKNKYR